MPKKKTKRLFLKPIEVELKKILGELEEQEERPKLTTKQAKTLARDIKKLNQLIRQFPPTCHDRRYNLGI